MSNIDPHSLEKDAAALLSEKKFEEAFKLFVKAADCYRSHNNHKQAALCFASAASCWALKSGENAFDNAAISYKEAARQAAIAGDWGYASLLYKYAAINFERDMDFLNFSECFYRSKECYRKFLTLSLFNPKRLHHITVSSEQKGIIGGLRRFLSWSALTISFLIWGHGEHPIRTIFCAIFLVFICSILYMLGELITNGVIFKPGFLDAVYFSVVTFTTVGFGDITAVGFNKFIVIMELAVGIFIVPLFIVGLSRKYLRV